MRRGAVALLRTCERRLSGEQFGTLSGCNGSTAGQHEQRLAGATAHEVGPPESGRSPPAPYAALLALKAPVRMTAKWIFAIHRSRA